MSRLTFYVANSLTGRIIGRLKPNVWSWEDPVTGAAKGELTVPIPRDSQLVEQLVAITRPHICQVCVRDEIGRWWFGGPILADPGKEKNMLKIPVGDWRSWFYAAAIRPDGVNRVEYLHVAGSANGQVEQNLAMSDIANLALDTIGAPMLVVDAFTASTEIRDVTVRMFKITGEALDNVSRRANGPDWHTYIASDPTDDRNVIAHLKISWPERSTSTGTAIALRREIAVSTKQDAGGNIIDYDWPSQPVPPSRVIGISSDPPPDEKWAIAEDPALIEGEALAWDEVWQLPEGIATTDAAFDQSLGRLQALAGDLGTIAVDIKVGATDIGSWGPGDRCRLTIRDGWRDIELDSARILGRTLTGRGPHVMKVVAQVNLGGVEQDIEDPIEVADE